MVTNSEHTSKRFDQELEAIINGVAQMGGMVTEQFSLAMESLSSGDTTLIKRVLDLGYQVNTLDIDIDRNCNLVLAHRQPEAIDLRTILTVLKITADLERIGAQAEHIAHRSDTLYHRGNFRLPLSLSMSRCADIALSMTVNSLEAFAASDVKIASQVIREDITVNNEYDFITRNLIGYMLEDPRTISAALDLLFIAKAIERIGDHAKNISEYVIFMVKGKNIRHSSPEELDRIILH